jgi:hypothetical protein
MKGKPMKKFIYYAAYTALLLLAFACKTGIEAPEATDSGKVTVGIYIQNPVTRSVLPQMPLSEITSYKLLGNGNELAVFTAINNASISIARGTWNFTLSAYKGSTLFLQGEITNKIISSSQDTLDFLLLPLISEGQGSISVTVSFPESAGIASVSVVTGEGTEMLEISGNSVVYSKEAVNAGNHFVSFRLKDANGTTLAVISELVIVGANLRSEKTINLQPDDLKFIALIPVGISAEAEHDGSIRLTWQALAGAAVYKVHRSGAADGVYEYCDESTVPSYTDTAVAAGSTYYYKISAVNGNGAESSQSTASEPATAVLALTSFNIAGSDKTEIEGTAITVTMPTIVNLTNLVPAVVHSGASVTPDSGRAQDFTAPQTYRITAQNGDYKDYTVTVQVTDNSLQAALAWVAGNAETNGDYTIILQKNEALAPVNLFYSKTASVTIKGGSSGSTVSLNTTGSLFAIGSGLTLALDGNVTLAGISNNTKALVQVNTGGTFVMNDGVKITGNASSTNGGALNVGGTFTMNGGEISGNSAPYGGGVCVGGGTFTKTGGIIYGSDASAVSLKNTAAQDGNAVYIEGGKKRNTTAGITANLDSGTNSGWEQTISVAITTPLEEWDLGVQSQQVGENTLTQFSVNGGYASYQWYVDGNLLGTNAVYAFDATGKKRGSVYELSVIVTDANGEQRSGRCKITVAQFSVGNIAAGVIVALSDMAEWDLLQSQTVAQGAQTVFSASGAYAGYAWYLDGSPVGTKAAYTFDAAGKKAGAVYELAVVATNASGEQRSGRCKITIINY